MGAKVAVDTTGLARFRELARAAARRVLEQEAELTVLDAKQRAPVDTGALRDSISWHREDENTVAIEAAASYAGFQEFGTVYQSGTPFMTPALDQTSVRLPISVARALEQAVREAS